MSSSGKTLQESVQEALASQKTSSKAGLFLSMDKALVEKLLAAMTPKTFNKGDFVIRKGEPHKEMLIVEEGALEKVFAVAAPGVDVSKEHRVSVQRGEVVGMLHFYAEDASGADVVCAQDGTRVLALSSATFRSMLAQDAALSSAFTTLLSRRLRKEMNVLRSFAPLVAANSNSNGDDKAKSGRKFRVAFFDKKTYFKESFDAMAAKEGDGAWLEMSWFDALLSVDTAALAAHHDAVCVFVNDDVSAPVLARLAELGVGLIALRCAGYDNVDLTTASALKLAVTRVPAYSPSAVAEFAVTLLLTLNRKVHKAHDRVRQFNFSLEGLVGFDLRGKTVGVFGTGRIGVLTSQIFLGFGCRVIACDLYESAELKAQGVVYVGKEQLLREADVLSLHAPLTASTKHWLDAPALALMKRSAVVINTSRGALVDTEALLAALVEQRIAGAAMDVVEGEGAYFFRDQSNQVGVASSAIARLIALPNVVLTGHQAFLTREALDGIAQSTLGSIRQYGKEGKRGEQLTNFVKPQY